MSKPLRAVIYTRISQDRKGEQVGVDRQEARCRERIAEKGWTLTRVYQENDRSAMKGRRPQFDQMLADLERIDVIVVWAADRLYRRSKDLERLVDALQGTKVETLHSGDVDLSTADGRSFARVLGAMAQRESEKTAERVADAREARVRAGRNAGGPRPLGYTGDRTALVPAEADAIKRAYAHIASGGSLHSLQRQWRASGVVGVRGGVLSSSQIRDILLREMNCGLIVHRGQVVGSSGLAIVDQALFHEVKARLTANKRWVKAPTTLLSGIAVCALCGGPVRASGEDRYRCHDRGEMTARRGLLDAFVSERVVAVLSQDFDTIMATMLAEDAPDTTEMDALRAELATIQGLAGTLSEAALAAAEASVRERMAAAAAGPQRDRTAFLNGLRGSGAATFWEMSPTHARREILKWLVERVIVHPRPQEPEIVWTRIGARRAA